ncbi:hypothetical protein [Paraburkholderia sp. J63]|uniref:hypothetical protein n=1 Tax=Paraburkholderia sp. J63 TaxID=2805434 RepID=UPI002ABDBEE2|nr:hypothetical protein [Paraburkholderia sp. J63]
MQHFPALQYSAVEALARVAIWCASTQINAIFRGSGFFETPDLRLAIGVFIQTFCLFARLFFCPIIQSQGDTHSRFYCTLARARTSMRSAGRPPATYRL